MIGRAGRKGIDTEGESILLCREADRKRVEQLVTSDLKPVQSCLIQVIGNPKSACLHFYTAKTQAALGLPFLPYSTLRVEHGRNGSARAA